MFDGEFEFDGDTSSAVDDANEIRPALRFARLRALASDADMEPGAVVLLASAAFALGEDFDAGVTGLLVLRDLPNDRELVVALRVDARRVARR